MTDRRIQDKVLQLGSLNDELRRVIELTNGKNEEYRVLADALETLVSHIQHGEKELAKFKDRNLVEESRHETAIENLENITEAKQKDVEKISDFVTKLETRVDHLKEELKTFTEEKKKLDVLKRETTKLASRWAEVERVNRTLKSLANKESKLREKNVKEESRLNEMIKKIQNERMIHRAWLIESKRETDNLHVVAVHRIDDLEIQKKDLRVVTTRLKKIWEKTTNDPFPKIYNA